METLRLNFFHCRVAQPLCELIEGYMVHILGGNFFVLEASSDCSIVMPQLKRNEQYGYLLGIMRVVTLMTRQEMESFLFLNRMCTLSNSLMSSSERKGGDSLQHNLAEGG